MNFATDVCAIVLDRSDVREQRNEYRLNSLLTILTLPRRARLRGLANCIEGQKFHAAVAPSAVRTWIDVPALSPEPRTPSTVSRASNCRPTPFPCSKHVGNLWRGIHHEGLDSTHIHAYPSMPMHVHAHPCIVPLPKRPRDQPAVVSSYSSLPPAPSRLGIEWICISTPRWRVATVGPPLHQNSHPCDCVLG